MVFWSNNMLNTMSKCRTNESSEFSLKWPADGLLTLLTGSLEHICILEDMIPFDSL